MSNDRIRDLKRRRAHAVHKDERGEWLGFELFDALTRELEESTVASAARGPGPMLNRMINTLSTAPLPGTGKFGR